MEITGKVHCFFEQSGTFKNEFIKLGIPAEYYTELWEFERHRNRLMIRNVHQLQHALRLAGVEKEIEV